MKYGITAEDLYVRARPITIARTSSLLSAIVLMLIVFISWANWAKLDEQVRVTGKVVVSSRSQIIQVVDGGVLSVMHVREGQSVEAGELLAELDTARFAASVEETSARVRSLRANVERLSAEVEGKPLTFSAEVAEDKELMQGQQELHRRRMQQQKQQRENIERSLELAQEELGAMQELARTGDAAQSELLRARRQVVDLQSELINVTNEYRREAQAELSERRAELEQTLQVLKNREEALRATRIRAPMSGSVKNIEVGTIGAVLRSGDELMQIVPSDDPLLVEARVPSKDVAFVRPELKANVKLDAYDFTVYGSSEGRVTYVSPDTIDEDLRQNEQPYYRALVEIVSLPERPGVDPVTVIPGMTATVEIITGQKTVAQYLLKPLRRGSAEALTER